ncbi:hypothetical protein [Streptomyces sp. WAC06614]|uniref:hypothetical protein n=1 Tax=Streptomyces sp. WAC06614 TaxID=2487416 RepID=UPI00163BD86C|nr:hypothetical protein [Streptomyces sp. WAC06614]
MKSQVDTQPISRSIAPEERVRTCRPARLRQDCCLEPAEPREEAAGHEVNLVRGDD